MIKKCLLLVLILALYIFGCSNGESPKVSPETDNRGVEKEKADKPEWINPPIPEGAEGTFVVTASIVFVREDPKKVLPHESMSMEELDGEYHWSYERPFPAYSVYGENIEGKRDKKNPDVVKTELKQFTWEKGEEKENGTKTGYIDIKKLWHEPPLEKLPTSRYMCLKDENIVYLVPDKKSRVVMSLYKGEVIEVAGQLNYGGTTWVKAKFASAINGTYYGDSDMVSREGSAPYNRYGYIEAEALMPLQAEKIDVSNSDLSEIPKSMRYSDLSFSDKERERLAKDGFYIETLSPNSGMYVDDMVDLYQRTKSAVFITSDLYLHSFHLIFDRMVQNIEEEKIFPTVKSLTLRLVEETKKEIESSEKQGANIQKALLHNLFFFSVAGKLFDTEFVVPQEVRSDVNAIVEKIVKAEGPLPSLENKIDLGDEDFTQYRVRGHYQKKEIHNIGDEEVEIDDNLERYFRGMMWYGRHPLLISSDSKTLSAILIVRALQNSGSFKEWEKIDSVLTRLIGKTDDWTPKDYENVNMAIFGKKAASLDDRVKGGDKAIKDFKEKAVQILPKQKIVSTQTGTGRTQTERIEMTSGFKFLGQRFTWDAYIFNQLTSPSVGSDANPRNLPTSLDVMSILGSKAAEEVMAEIRANQKWDNYDSQVEKIKKEITGEIEKKETTYNSWMNTLKALFGPIESRQLFAIKAPWQFKSLNTVLGSWTELKHDTILYAEQSYAESGSGDSFEIPEYEPPYVKGYVEPNPIFFSRLLEMVSNLRTDLEKAGFVGYKKIKDEYVDLRTGEKVTNFISDEYKDKLITFESLVKKAGEIAKKEVEGSSVTRDDYRWLMFMSSSFDRKLLLPRDIGDVIQPDYLQMALIADVATDAVSGQALEVAVGAPQRIIVTVKDADGGTRNAVGYVYSWYEFADKKRWTDKEWKDMVYSSDEKLKKVTPSWYSRFQK